MNILINYMGTDGAGRLIALSLAKAFIQNGVDVYAVLSQNEPRYEEWISLLGNKHVFWAENYQNSNKLDFTIKTIKMFTSEGRKIRNFFYGIEFDYSIRPMYHHWAYLIDKSLRIEKIVTICHNPVMHSDEKEYFRKLYKQHITQSNKIIVLTKSYVSLVNKEFGFALNDILYVPLGRIDEYTIYPPKQIKDPYSVDKINFLFFGLLRKYKGLHVLAKAYSIVSNKYNNVSLHVVGTGSLDEYAEEFNKCKNIFFDNRYINDDEISGYFSGPNVVVVLPYIDASQSGIIQVSLEYENTVIASNTDALREQLDDGNIGLFFEPGNADELAERMIEVIGDSSIRESQAILMRALREKLDWNNICHTIIDFLS